MASGSSLRLFWTATVLVGSLAVANAIAQSRQDEGPVPKPLKGAKPVATRTATFAVG